MARKRKNPGWGDYHGSDHEAFLAHLNKGASKEWFKRERKLTAPRRKRKTKKNPSSEAHRIAAHLIESLGATAALNHARARRGLASTQATFKQWSDIEETIKDMKNLHTRKNPRTRRNSPLTKTEKKALRSILRKHRRNPDTHKRRATALKRLKTRRESAYVRVLRQAKKKTGNAVWAGMHHTAAEKVLHRAIIADAGISRRFSKKWSMAASSRRAKRQMKRGKILAKLATRSNPGTREARYRLSDGTVVSATGLRRMFMGKIPGPSHRRLLGIERLTKTKRNPLKRRAKARRRLLTKAVKASKRNYRAGGKARTLYAVLHAQGMMLTSSRRKAYGLKSRTSKAINRAYLQETRRKPRKAKR